MRQQMALDDVVMLVFGSICQQQGINLEMPKTSGRIVIITIHILTLFVFIAYSAKILVLLQSPSHAIKSIDNLISSPIKLTVQDTVYNRYFFEKENGGVVETMYEKKIN